MSRPPRARRRAEPFRQLMTEERTAFATAEATPGQRPDMDRPAWSWRRRWGYRAGGSIRHLAVASLTWLVLSAGITAGYSPRSTSAATTAGPIVLDVATADAGRPAAGAVPAARRVASVPAPRVRAQAAIILDPVTGETLWERNSHDLRSIASLTKLMTVMLFLEQQPDLSREVVISRRDVRRASTTYLRRGERVTLRDLVHLALVASDNAAARVLARVSPWGTKRFIVRMNGMAADLGLRQTRFTDPSGLDGGNVSSAYEVARLIAEASERPQMSEVMRKRSYQIHTSRRTRTILSTNKLLGTRVDVMAGKTGYIDLAGYCLATLVQLDDDRAVSIVVLGARSNSSRFTEARRLANWLSTQASVILTSAAE